MCLPRSSLCAKAPRAPERPTDPPEAPDAKESVTFREEPRQAGFRKIEIVTATRNGRTTNPSELAAQIVAIRWK